MTEYYKIKEAVTKQRIFLYNTCDRCDIKLHPDDTHDYTVRIVDHWSSYNDSYSEIDSADLCEDCYNLILLALKEIIPNLGLDRKEEVKDEI